MGKQFTVVIEQDEDGKYVGYVPDIKGCHSQGDTIDELLKNIREAIALCLEVAAMKKGEQEDIETRFIGVQQVEIA